MTTQQNLDIFICTHKDFNPCPHSPYYKIISAYPLTEDKYSIPIIYEKNDEWLKYQKIINEFTYMAYVYENVPLKDYIGFNHYRRFYEFYDNVPDLDTIFKDFDVICNPTIAIPETIEQQYANAHNIEDLNTVDFLIQDETLLTQWIEYKHSPCYAALHPSNMFIMRKNDFIKYMEFILSLVKSLLSYYHINSYEEALLYVIANKEKYFVKTIEKAIYQSRFIGFIIERLTSFFLWNNFKNPKTFRLIGQQ